MQLELVRASHNVGESNFHLVFVVAYRRKVFSSKHNLDAARAYTEEKALSMKVKIEAMEFGPDHVHLFLSHCRRYSAEELARLLKGYVSRMMRMHHAPFLRAWLWGKKFWTSGYFYRSVGSVNSETVKFYIDHCQAKHWDISY